VKQKAAVCTSSRLQATARSGMRHSLAMHDHILFLDADEFLGQELSTSILVEKIKVFPVMAT